MRHQHNAWSYLQKQARLTPDKAAIIDEKDQVVTFDQFLSECDKAAALLHGEGIDQTSRVALNAGASRDCLITAFALIRCGAVIVPIDIRFPELAVKTMVGASACTHIVTNGTAPNGVKAVPLDFSGLTCDGPPPEPAPRGLAEEGLILFTSGSTGEPKGVSIASGFFLERFSGHNSDPGKTVMSLFKGSITWICVIPVVELCRGDTVLMMPYDTLVDPEAFLQRLIQYEVNEFGTVPSHLRLLTPCRELLGQMKRIYVWGEFITDDLIETMRSTYPKVELFDIYSATESLGYGAIRRLSGTDYNFASGWRADNGYGMHVLKENNQAAGVGERGEIAFSGGSLATDYIGHPELTAKKFFDNPFGEGRLYRTGDIGTLMADGTITLHGREDAQVQIRGIRIELTEIESCVAQYAGVTSAAAFVIADDDDVLSIGLYITPTSVDISALRRHLSQRLSYYAMPSYIAALDELPRTSSGKLNRKELHRDLNRQPPPAAMDETEARLVAIFSELLDVTPVRPDDDFYELGGHSLLLAKLIAKISAALQVDVSPLEATQNASPRKLSALIKGRQETEECRTSQIEIPSELPLLKEAVLWFGFQRDVPSDVDAWKRDMYASEFLGGYINYAFVEIPICIDSEEKLQRALTYLFHRHPILRSRAPAEQPPTRLCIVPFSLDDYLVNGYGGRLEEAERMQLFRELTELFEVPLVKIYVHDGHLHFAFHHILSDHTSMNIVKRDFVEIAEAFARETRLPAVLDYSLIAKCIAYESRMGDERDSAPLWVLPADRIEAGQPRVMDYRFELPSEALEEVNDGDLLPSAVAALISALHDITGQLAGNLHVVLDLRSLNLMPYNMTNHIGCLSFIKLVYLSYHGSDLTRQDDVLNHYRKAMRNGKNELPPVHDGSGVVVNYMESDGPLEQRVEQYDRAYRVAEDPACAIYDWGPTPPSRWVWIDVTHYKNDRRMRFDVYTSRSGHFNESMISFCALVQQHMSPNNTASRVNTGRAKGTEGCIRGIFSELLDVPAVDADDDFFDLGGHPLLLGKLVATLNTIFAVQLSPSDAARLSTPRKLASFIDDRGAAESRGPAGFAAPTEIPLSPEALLWFGHRIDTPEDREELQRRILATPQLFGHVIYKSFEMPATINSQERLGQVLTHLFKRHPILCSRIPHQESPRHMDLVPFCLSDYQVNAYREAPDREATAAVYRNLSLLYDVPLVKIHSEGKTIHFAMHRILSDHSSLRIIKKDFFDIARALEYDQPLPKALDYAIIAQYLPSQREAGDAADALMPWRLDSDKDTGLADRALMYRMDFPAKSIKHILPRDLLFHAIHAIISAMHDITGQAEGDLFMVEDQRSQESTRDHIVDHIGYLSLIRPVRISHHGPNEDRRKIMAHYRDAIREGKLENGGDPDDYRTILSYVENDGPICSPLQESAKNYQIDRDKVCTVFDFGEAPPLKQAFVMVTYQPRERSLQIDLHTYHRRYGKQRMMQFCRRLRRRLRARKWRRQNGAVPPAQ